MPLYHSPSYSWSTIGYSVADGALMEAVEAALLPEEGRATRRAEEDRRDRSMGEASGGGREREEEEETGEREEEPPKREMGVEVTKPHEGWRETAGLWRWRPTLRTRENR